MDSAGHMTDAARMQQDELIRTLVRELDELVQKHGAGSAYVLGYLKNVNDSIAHANGLATDAKASGLPELARYYAAQAEILEEVKQGMHLQMRE